MNATRMIRRVLAACALLVLSPPASGQAAGDWIDLIGEGGLKHWRPAAGDAADDWFDAADAAADPADEKLLTASPGRGVIVNGKRGRTRNLFSLAEHGDIEAHVEFIVPKGSNSGVYFMGRYEIQILDSHGVEKLKHGDCGGIYQRWDDARGKGNEGFEGFAPRLNAANPPGQWQSFHVLFRAPRFNAAGEKIAHARFVKVLHNGQVIHENVDVTGPTRAGAFDDEKPAGPIMLQGDHGPVGYRNIRFRRVNLDPAEPPNYAGRTVEQWAAMLDAPRQVERLRAANTLATLGPAGLPPLRDVLKHHDAAMRYWAARGYAEPDRATRQRYADTLAAMLTDPSPVVRVTAAYGLRYTTKHDQAIAALIEGLNAERRGITNVAADHLAAIGPRAAAALPRLKELTAHGDEYIKRAATHAVEAIER